ncbi:TLC domain-containing protein [Gorgonomyces haynaldii]|nr:TLC domain-containing protein [Gorgonomyces haynaldii]
MNHLIVQFIGEPLGRLTGLEDLAAHTPWIIYSWLFYHLVHDFGMRFSQGIAGYDKLSQVKKHSWAMHITSIVNAPLVSVMAIMGLFETFRMDHVYGYSAHVATTLSLAVGYFLYDTLLSWHTRSDAGIGFVFHGLGSFLKPVFHYYSCLVLLFEVSTIFLNIHWFCDKIGLTGSTFQWINGIFLLLSFFSIRLVMTPIFIVEFWSNVLKMDLPVVVSVFYFVMPSALTLLNVFWFYRMIASLQARMKDNKAVEDDGYGKLSTKKKQ